MVKLEEEEMAAPKRKVEQVAGGPRQIAERVGCGENMIRTLVQKKKLAARKVGKRVFIKFADADRLFLGK